MPEGSYASLTTARVDHGTPIGLRNGVDIKVREAASRPRQHLVQVKSSRHFCDDSYRRDIAGICRQELLPGTEADAPRGQGGAARVGLPVRVPKQESSIADPAKGLRRRMVPEEGLEPSILEGTRF